MFLRHLYPALLWALFILLLCAIPGPHIPRLTFLDWLQPDKIAHLVLFGVLCYLLIKGFRKQQAIQTFTDRSKVWAVLLSSVYGAVVELLQQYVFAKRSGEVLDVLADALGAFLGLWLYVYWVKRKSAAQTT